MIMYSLFSDYAEYQSLLRQLEERIELAEKKVWHAAFVFYMLALNGKSFTRNINIRVGSKYSCNCWYLNRDVSLSNQYSYFYLYAYFRLVTCYFILNDFF